MSRIILFLALLLLGKCAVAQTVVVPAQTVAQVVAQPPAPGTTITVQGWRGIGLFCDPEDCWRDFPDGCPPFKPAYIMTDRWLPSMFIHLHNQIHNLPLNELLAPPTPWLLLVPAATYAPYHLQVWGHLGGEAYAHCPFAEHIFVVEAVGSSLPDQPLIPWSVNPADGVNEPKQNRSEWHPWTDPVLGYTLLIPTDAVVRPVGAHDDLLGGATVVLADAPSLPIEVRVYADQVYRDPFDHQRRSPHLAEGGVGHYTQYQREPFSGAEQAPLAGFYQLIESAQQDESRVWFEAGGRSFMLGTRIPLGWEVHEAQLLRYATMVDTFHPNIPQSPTPTSAINQTLGAGPFLAQAEAWTRMQTHLQETSSRTFTLQEAALLSEAAIRRLGREDEEGDCDTMHRHPSRVWAFRVLIDPPLPTIPGVVYVGDATTGKLMCTLLLKPERPLVDLHP